jgi:hypothetical protein
MKMLCTCKYRSLHCRRDANDDVNGLKVERYEDLQYILFMYTD